MPGERDVKAKTGCAMAVFTVALAQARKPLLA
jgi:hypothetical protein